MVVIILDGDVAQLRALVDESVALMIVVLPQFDVLHCASAEALAGPKLLPGGYLVLAPSLDAALRLLEEHTNVE